MGEIANAHPQCGLILCAASHLPSGASELRNRQACMPLTRKVP